MSDEPFARCDDCNKSFSGPEPYMEHLSSKSHDKKMIEKGKILMFQEVPSNENKLRCEVCDVFLSGKEPMKQHMNGNKHLSMLKKKEIMNTIEPEHYTPSESVLSCKVCEKCFSGPENMKQHMKSKKHIRKMDLVSMKQQLNGGVAPSCPPPPSMDLPKQNLYPSLTEDYKIVHSTIANNEGPKKAKKSMGCFSAVKSIFKSKKNKLETSVKSNYDEKK